MAMPVCLLHLSLLLLLQLLQPSRAHPASLDCADDSTTALRPGGHMMGVNLTSSSKVNFSLPANTTAYTAGSALQLTLTGLPNCSFVAVRVSGQLGRLSTTTAGFSNKCDSQIYSETTSPLNGTTVKLSWLPPASASGAVVFTVGWATKAGNGAGAVYVSTLTVAGPPVDYDMKFEAQLTKDLSLHWAIDEKNSLLHGSLQLKGSSSWVGLGLGSLKMKGADYIVGEVMGDVPMVRAYQSSPNNNGEEAPVLATDQSALVEASGSVADQLSVFNFSRHLVPKTGLAISQGASVDIIWAHYCGADCGQKPDVMGWHGESKGSKTINFWTGGEEMPSNVLMKLHVACMTLGWMFCIFTGMFTARFMKQAMSVGTPQLWYRMHLWMQLAGVALTIVGLATAWADSGQLQLNGTHQKLGMVVCIVALLQALWGVLRPAKGPSMVRAAWELSHWWLGKLGFGAAVVNIGFGLNLVAAAQGAWVSYILSCVLISVSGVASYHKFAPPSGPPPKEQPLHEPLNPSQGDGATPASWAIQSSRSFFVSVLSMLILTVITVALVVKDM